MQLTDQQRSEIERQRRENPDVRHITITPTPEQEAEVQRAIDEEEAARPESSADARKFIAALEEPGFSGDLRRAIIASGKEPEDLARSLGLSTDTLEGFLDGDAPLPFDVVDRLVALLRLKLMLEIPR